MEILEFIKQIPLPILIIAILILLAVTVVMMIQYAKTVGVEGIRTDVYQLMLRAEHVFKESGAGKQKLEWVVQRARSLLPRWMQVLLPYDVLIKIIDKWFWGVKDLLDDGKINQSQQ